MSLGSKIKELRNRNGMTQKELSEKLNVTAQAVSRWESDEVEPSVQTIKQMSAIFNVSIDELFGNETEPKVVEVEKIVEKPVVVEKDVVVEKPVIVEKQVVVEKAQKQIIHMCEYCKKPIYEGDVFETVTHHYGRGRHSDYIVHTKCKLEKEERQKQANIEKSKKRFSLSIIVGAISSVVMFLIFMAMALNSEKDMGLLFGVGAVAAVLTYTTVSCFILSNNFLFELWCDIASWSIKFPGIIFTFDFDGLKFLIIMKLLFAVLGVIISILAVIAASLIAGGLSIFVYPYALVKNIKHPEEID